MNYTEEFRNIDLVKALLSRIGPRLKKKIRLMEVCGGHTMAIRRYGIHTLLPEEIELLSGPGCPVCVTGQHFIDIASAYAQMPDAILLTYGDLIRVPGSNTSLEKVRARGADVRIINSTIEALSIAQNNPHKKVIFAAIGFETTVPGTAVAIKNARMNGLTNFFVLNAHKTMPAAMSALIEEGISIDGYIGPGHVCAIAGSKIFDVIAMKYHVPVVVSGFEPVDLVQSVYMLVDMISAGRTCVEIQYKRLVTHEGNPKAMKIVDEVFEPDTQIWRGIGPIENSGLKIRKEYSGFDIEVRHPVQVPVGKEPKGCRCGDVLKGIVKPFECNLFGKACIPSHPIGACMVSSEGACNAYYTYRSIS